MGKCSGMQTNHYTAGERERDAARDYSAFQIVREFFSCVQGLPLKYASGPGACNCISWVGAYSTRNIRTKD
jgi:hypothetical protein